MIDKERVAAIRARYDGCFGCGTSNQIGLRLNWFMRDGNRVRVQFRPPQQYSGFTDVVHGGIVASALDEVMAWTAMLVEGVIVVTGTLDLRFRRPARTGTEFALVGTLESRRGRRLMIAATMLDGDTVVAEASAMFLVMEDLD
ncbi:MAG: PaaI family thioesterase [Acidimicrobiia bacterium]